MYSPKKNSPDVGPKMIEGEQTFDKGYESDSPYFSPPRSFSDNNYRGNDYMPLQNEIVSRDVKKIKSSKFSKIA